MQFPTLHCRCPNGHIWASLVPQKWFELKDIQCPECDHPASGMKAGGWKTLEEIKKAFDPTPIVPVAPRQASENNN